MYAPLVTRLNDWLLTTDRKQRLRITRSLMAANVFVACCFLQMYAAWVGYMDVEDVKRLSGAILLNIVAWYLILRSGINLRFDDPAMTLPQILSALTIIVGAYSVTGPVHGSTLMLLALVLVFGIFNMQQRGAIIAGGYTVVLVGIAILIKMRTDPVNYPFKLEVAHFVLTAAIVPTISSLAAQLSNLRARLQAQKDELANALVRIQILATRDELTGLINRRHMLELMEQERQRGVRSGQSFCISVIDIDSFHQINEQHGPAFADELLRRFANEALNVIRISDLLSRWDGKEFLLMLSDTRASMGRLSIERLRERIQMLPLEAAGEVLHMSFSAGVTEHRAGESVSQTVQRAELALLNAKAGGHNRVVLG